MAPLFQTNAGAPNYQMVTFDFLADKPADHLSRSDPWPMKTLVAEDERNVLEWAACVNKDKLVLCYMKDVKNVLDVHHLESGRATNAVSFRSQQKVYCN